MTEEPHKAKTETARLAEILSVIRKSRVGRGMTPRKLRLLLEQLGPTFVKVGQILSMRPEILSEEYRQELEKLREQALPIDYDEIRDIVRNELGSSVEELFASFEAVPSGSASIAQVHRAVLKSGEQVVVKVQRPDIEKTMELDIRLMKRLVKPFGGVLFANVVDPDIVLDEIWETAREEMDFLNEARNIMTMAENAKGVNYITFPAVFERLSTSRVLVMEYIDGIRIDELERLDEQGYNRTEIGTKLAESFVKQVVDDGLFHADPHPGNILIRGGKIVWLDLGMTGKLSKAEAAIIGNAVRAAAENDSDALTAAVLQIGVHDGTVDRAALSLELRELMDRYFGMPLHDMNIVKVLEEVLTVAASYKISVPKGLSMLARSLMTIEGVLALVSPSIDVTTILVNHMSEGLFDRTLKELNPTKNPMLWLRLLSSLRAIPEELNTYLKKHNSGASTLANELSFSKKAQKSLDCFVKSLCKCLFACAFIVGGCLLVRAEGFYSVLGFSLPSIILFAAAGLIYLIPLCVKLIKAIIKRAVAAARDRKE